jgi:MFS family permease
MTEQTQQRTRPRFGLNTFAALRYRDYRLLWFAQVGTGFAQQGEMLTRSWLILELTGSGLMLAAAHVTRAFGSLAVTPIVGVLADRFDRRVLLITANIVKAISFVGIGLLVLFGWIVPWHVIASAIIAGAGQALQQTSSQAVIPSLVPREGIMNAVSLHSVTMGIDRIMGPFLAGLLIAVIGVHGAYFAAAGALVFPVFLYALMRPLRLAKGGPKESFITSFKQGIQFAVHSPQVRVVLLVAMTTMGLGMPFLQLMPLYVTDVLDRGPATLGLILSLPGFLTVGGALFAASLGDFPYKGRLLFTAVLSPGIAALIMSQTSMVWTTILATCIFGALSSQYGPASRTAVMKATPDEMRGRVSSLLAVNMGWSSVGIVLYGVVAEFSSIQTSYLLFGGLCLTLNIIYFVTMRSYRQLS